MNWYTRVLEDRADAALGSLNELERLGEALLTHNPRYARALEKRKTYWANRYATMRLQLDSAEIFGKD